MKILVVCQHYWPEPFPLTNICEELVKLGNDVHVITDIPNYPMGEVYPGYENHMHRIEEHNGVKITRAYTIPRKHNIFFRFLNYYSYSIFSTNYAKKLKDDYDVVFTNQTSPIMMTRAAFAYARKHSKKVVLYCMDLWPASLAAGGIKENSIIYTHYKKVSGDLYRKADRVLITSQMFKGYLMNIHQVEESRICYLPQYAESRFDNIKQKEKNNDTFDFVFAGNIGVAQSIKTIIKAAEILKNDNRIYWHIIGDGSELENIKLMAADLRLSNVIFYGRKPIEDMPKYYELADAMLVTLTKDPFISLTLPGKVQTYMAAGKPIIGAALGEIPRVISDAHCGYCAHAEDSKGLADAVQSFIKCQNRSELGKNAKEFYDNHFSKQKFMSSLLNELETYCQK